MPQTATRKRPATKAGAKKAASRPSRKVGNSNAKAGRSVSKVRRRAASKAARRPVATGARIALRAVARRAGRAALRGGREVVERAVRAGANVTDGLPTRPPIQCSIDVAVPIAVAWEEWMALECLPEGVHDVLDIERNDGELVGDVRGAEWIAEVRDERPEESFAWRSVEGSDCAGLVTFHRLSDRLTRIELNLDVRPRGPAEALCVRTRLADRRADAELRRFKARVEFLSPDEYEDHAKGRQR